MFNGLFGAERHIQRNTAERCCERFWFLVAPLCGATLALLALCAVIQQICVISPLHFLVFHGRKSATLNGDNSQIL